MIKIEVTAEFLDWKSGLDKVSRARINARILKLEAGLWGDWKKVQGTTASIIELREDFGPGYRIYVTRRGQDFVVVLAAGAKKSQTADIETAIRLAEQL